MVQLCASTVPLSSPAGMVTAPLGGAEGPPPRIAWLPHTRAGGDAGLAVGGAGPAPDDAGPVGAERSNPSVSAVRPAQTITAAAQYAINLPLATLIPGPCSRGRTRSVMRRG